MQCERPKVLLVDDDPAILDALKRCLRREFNLETAESAQSALFLASVRGPYDAVVADIVMPEMDGIALLSQFAQYYPRTARIALSASADLTRYRDAFEIGHAYSFISKPCQLPEFVAAVRVAISASERTPSGVDHPVAV